ncbi:DJ-1/PfpI family protein, partial [Aeromonas sp. EERV15]|uniref:DJ-1/PfpI family protein n=1 Tax=Aeromonas sp. EERV15 TaxID=1833892 RepID=UPI00159F1BD3
VQAAVKFVGKRNTKPAVAGAPSPALSMENTVKGSVATRKVAALVADGVSAAELKDVKTALEAAGAQLEVVVPRLGAVKTAAGGSEAVTMALPTVASVLCDAVLIPGGKASVEALLQDGAALHFVNEAFKHYKTVGATGEGVDLVRG